MPDLKCNESDLNGFGCISSQFTQSLTYTTGSPAVSNPQWFGKITRFRYELELPDGSRVSEDDINRAITAGEIVSSSVKNITYTPDPVDQNVAYAEGEVEIVANTNSPIPSSPADKPYRFRHTIHHVWRLTETRLT